MVDVTVKGEASEDQALRSRADELVRLLYSRSSLDEASALLDQLRDKREFEWLETLAEAVSRHRPRDPRVRRLLAQSLIDRGLSTVAIDVIEATLASLAAGDDALGERDELIGLLGRAHKQVFIDSADASTTAARHALVRAAEAYKSAYDRDASHNFWHGVNLCAVLHAAKRRGVRAFPDLDPTAVARTLQSMLLKRSSDQRDSDPWISASLAETHIALGEWSEALDAIQTYVNHPRVGPFNLASTLRQFRDVWETQKDSQIGAGIVQLLEAKLLGMGRSLGTEPYPVVTLKPSEVRQTLAEELPADLEAKLGDVAGVSIRWYRTGLERATSVAAVRVKLGSRIGTGFAIRAGDFGVSPNDAVLLLTNYHVTNTSGELGAPLPSQLEVSFEAAGSDSSPMRPVPVLALLAESPVTNGLDYALLWLGKLPPEIRPVPVAQDLPPTTPQSLVYIIGHPLGEEMHISLQDNALIDHEGPPSGQPPVPARRRVHYRAPTEPGSSGSPVFNAAWETIALHHAGRRYSPPNEPGMPMLNGKTGSYAANEGYWIRSVIDDVRAKNISLPGA